MEQMAAVQTVPSGGYRAKFGAMAGQQGLQGQMGAQTANGADFLAMLLGQMMPTEEQASNGSLSFLDAMFGTQLGGFGQMSGILGEAGLNDEEEQEGSERGAQMLAEMLFANSPVMDVLQQHAGAIDSKTLTQAANSVIGQQMAALGLSKDNQNGKSAQTAEIFNGALQKAMTAAEANPQVQATAEGTMDGLSGDAQFKNAVLEAQRLLKSSKQGEQTPEEGALNIEQLQNHADAARSAKTELVQQSELPDAKSLLDQVKNGITKNIGSGKEEFVIKLKPDGLGEITVKMVEQGSKISLSILTSDSQVAKMLGGEIAALRESLKQFNADVREIVSQSDAAYQAAQNGQNFSGGRNQQQRPEDLPYYYPSGGDAPIEDVREELNQLSGLDTYI